MNRRDILMEDSDTLQLLSHPLVATEIVWNSSKSKDHIIKIESDTLCALAEGSSHSNVQPRKTLCANAFLVAFLYKTHPGIRLISYVDNKKGVIGGFQSWIVDFSFAPGERNILVSVEESRQIWIHHIEDTNGILKSEVMHRICLSHMHEVWKLKLSTVSLTKPDDLYNGYLILGMESDIIALHMKPLQDDFILHRTSEMPRVGLGEYDGLFDISRDGRKVASCREGMVSIFLLPSPAIHTSWSPYNEPRLDALSFGTDSDTVITSSISEKNVCIWDIGGSDPFCKRKIIFPFPRFHVVSSPFCQSLFIFTPDSEETLEIDLRGSNAISDITLDRKLQYEDFQGIFTTTKSDSSLVFCRFSNKISSFYCQKKSTTWFSGKQSVSDFQLREVPAPPPRSSSVEYIECSSLPNSECQLYNPKNQGTGYEHTEALDVTPIDDSIKQFELQDTSYLNDSTEVSGKLVKTVNQTTRAVIRMTKMLTKYQNSILNLKSFTSTISAECKHIAKKSVKERINACALSLSYLKRAEQEPTVSISRSLAPTLALSLQNLNFVDVGSFEKEIMKHADIPFHGLQESLQLQISDACHETMSFADFPGFSQSLSQLNREISSHTIEKADVCAAISDNEFDKAIEIALETRSPDMLVWLLTEAQQIYFWSELVVDEALSPITVLSLVYNICVGLSTFSRVYPANFSEQLLTFVRDAVVTYRVLWTNCANIKLYGKLSAYCCNLLRSMENEGIQGPLCSCLREAVRLLET